MTIWNETDPIKIEKKRITRTANAIGVAFLIGFIGVAVVQLSILKFIPSEIVATDGFMWLVQIVLSALMFTVPFIIMTVPMNTRVSVACSFKKVQKGVLLPTVFCGMGVCAVANVLGSITTSVFYSLGFSDPNSALTADASEGLLLPLIAVLAGAFLPGLIEEFALRGIILGALKKFGYSFSIIVSAVLFGIMHGTLSQMPFAFIMGLYLGFVTIRTGSLWPAVVIHIINNLFAFLLESVSSVANAKSMVIINLLYFVVMFSLGLIGVLLSRKNDFFTMPETKTEETKLTLSQKLKTFFSSLGVILTIVYVALEIVLTQLIKVLQL